MKRILWGIVLLVLAVAMGYSVRPRPMTVELGTPARRDVREYIAEEAKTRLAEEYVVNMPLQGTLNRVDLEVGDRVRKGDVVATVDDFDLRQQARGIDYGIEQARARIAGVDMTKTKPEEVDSAQVREKEAVDALAMAEHDRSIAAINLREARRAYERRRPFWVTALPVKRNLTRRSGASEAPRKTFGAPKWQRTPRRKNWKSPG